MVVTSLCDGPAKICEVDCKKMDFIHFDNPSYFLSGRRKCQENIMIGFSQCAEFSVWSMQLLQSMQGEIAFYPEMELLYRDAENSSERQIEDIDYFIKNKVDLLIVSPCETDPITPVVEKAFQSGIPVIMVDRKINSSMYSAYIGANNYEIGKLAGNYIADVLEGKGSMVEIWGLRGSSPAVERHRGLWEVLAKYPDIKTVGEIDGKWEEDTSQGSGAKEDQKLTLRLIWYLRTTM